MIKPKFITSMTPHLVRAMYEWMTENNMTPHLRVNNKAAGVKAPPHLMKNPSTDYNISHMSIDQLHMGPDYVIFDARFGGMPYEISIPYAAIEAITSKETNDGFVFSQTSTNTLMSSGIHVPSVKDATKNLYMPPAKEKQSVANQRPRPSWLRAVD